MLLFVKLFNFSNVRNDEEFQEEELEIRRCYMAAFTKDNPENNRYLWCDYCSKVQLGRIIQMKHHLRMTHMDIIMCTQCSKKITILQKKNNADDLFEWRPLQKVGSVNIKKGILLFEKDPRWEQRPQKSKMRKTTINETEGLGHCSLEYLLHTLCRETLP